MITELARQSSLGDAQASPVWSLDFYFSGGRAPGRRDFHKGWGVRGWSRSEHTTRGVPAPFQRLGRQAELPSAAGDGQHGGERDGLGPQRVGDAPARRGATLPLLGKLGS